MLYFGTEDGADVNNGALHAINLSYAGARWSLTLINTNDQITSSPAISAAGTIRIRVTATDNAHFTKTSTQTINFIVP